MWSEDLYKIKVEEFFDIEVITDYSLDAIQRACDHFWNPEKSFKSIHIAGTNWKGSTSKMLFQMLKESSKKVGVYTSPHNIDIRERFETDQGIISKKAFLPYIDLCAAYTPVLSYYEKCVLIAFLYFRDQKVEYAIIEVGLGGRLDATNIIIPILSIITSISYDHMEFLGETLEQISYEKGGIIKSNIPVILYAENPTLESIALHRRSQVIRIDSTLSLQTNLIGDHQISNAQIAYEAGRYIGLSKEIMQEALLHVSHHGRLEYIETNLLIDGAHNEDGIRKLASYLDTISPLWNKIHYFFNLKSGKSARLVTDVFCTIEKFGVVDCNSFRISDAQTLREELRQIWVQSILCTPEEIRELSLQNQKDLFVVFGSLYMMHQFLEK